MSLEEFETRAHKFHVATGVMAPGKDVPAAMNGYDEQQLRYKLWCEWCRAEAAEARVAELEAAIREHRRAVHKTQIEALGCIAPTGCDDVLWAHVAPVEE